MWRQRGTTSTDWWGRSWTRWQTRPRAIERPGPSTAPSVPCQRTFHTQQREIQMKGWMPRLLLATAAAVTALLGISASAFAGTANYTSTATFGVPNNTGQAGVPSQVFVPPGRTPVQSLELTKVMPSFGGGGGQDLQLRLKSPNGPDIHILNLGCTTYPNTSAFTISDTATLSVDTPAFCTALTGAPT